MDSRTTREIASLLGVSETRLNKNRLLETRGPLMKTLATKATLLWNLPKDTFKNAILPSDYVSASEAEQQPAPPTIADVLAEIKAVHQKVDDLLMRK